MPINRPKSRMLDAGSTSAPQNLGATASAGTGPDFSFADHVHARPSAADVGAIATTAKAAANGVASLDGNARLNGVQMPAISGDITINAGETTAAVNKVKGISVSTPTVTGTIAQYDGTNIVWGSAPAGGSGGGGIVMFFNNGATGDAPLTNLPALTGGQTYKEFRRAAETGESSVVSPNLTSTYSNIAGFITDLNDPETVEITAGLWDFNIWAQTIDARTLLRAVLYKYDGGTTSSVTLATSAAVSVPTVAGQIVFSLIIPQTTIALTDRIFVVFQALNPAANHTVTLYFGGSTPSHTHTTLPSVGKTGVVKVINGVTQADASKIVNADVDDAAAIAQSKIDGLTTALSAKVGTGDTIAILKGGTGQTEKAAAFNALSPITAEGDLIIGTGANTAGRVAIGTNGKVLTSNGTTATWETPAAGGGVTTIANGGTGATTQSDARAAMGGIQTATVRYATTNIVPASAGTVTGASWTTGSAVLTYTSSTVTLVPGMSFNGSGITASVVKTVNSPTQVTLSANATGTSSGTLTAYNSTVTTMVTSAAPTVEGVTLEAGHIVVLATQNTSATGGPWQVVSNSGTSLSLVRPSWFQGTLSNPVLIAIQRGSSSGGFIVAVGSLAGNPSTTIDIGIDALAVATLYSRSTNAVLAGNTFAGSQTFAAGTASGVFPFAFQSSVLNTTPVAHRAEWDGSSFYLTNSAAVRKKLSYLEDGVTISATAPSAVVFDIESSEVVYHTANTTADFTLNLRGSSTLAMNSILEVNKARTVVLMVTNSTTAYKLTTVSVDGAAQTVKWLGGSAPTGNVSSIDSYSFTIIKTAANVYTVLGSVVKFA